MELTKELNAINLALVKARSEYDQAIKRADQILKNSRNEHTGRVTASAASIESLQNDLELYEALERDRDAARLRLEIAKAVEEHKAIVEGANDGLKAAVLDHVRSLVFAGAVLEASFSTAVAGIC